MADSEKPKQASNQNTNDEHADIVADKPDSNFLGLGTWDYVPSSTVQVLHSDRVPRPKWHQLLIIGNGFDLACGLKSSFMDFKKAREAFFESVDSSSEGVDETRFNNNVWDVILNSTGRAGWADIEHTIEQWVVPSKSGTGKLDRIVQRLTFHNNPQDIASSPEQDEQDTIAIYIYLKCGEDCVSWSRDCVLSRLSDDLDQLQRDFSHFLSEQILGNAEYRIMSEKLV